MTLLTLRARVCCDACGKNYDVELDPAAKCESGFGAVVANLRYLRKVIKRARAERAAARQAAYATTLGLTETQSHTCRTAA